jgi:hypothetical protein
MDALWSPGDRPTVPAVLAALSIPAPAAVASRVARGAAQAALLADADGNGNACLWHVATDELAGTFTGTSQAQAWGVAFSPDGKLLAIADGDGNVYVRVTSDFMS